jgi:hypothetical protein
MKTPIAIALAALTFLTATDASAYTWSPPKGSVRLHGKITFTPNEGGKPFKCSITMDFKPARSQITAVKFPHGDCEGVRFGTEFPWNVAIQGANSGGFAGGEFGSGSGICVQNGEAFQVNGSGIWTLTGECLGGNLTSNPPTTIVP